MHKLLKLSLLLTTLLMISSCSTPLEKEKIKGFDTAGLDTTYAPCNDFFMYASGNWQRNNPIPSTESRWGSFNILIEENNLKIKQLLEKLLDNPAHKKGSYEQLLADFYAASMDSIGMEQNTLEPFKELLKKMQSFQNTEDFSDQLAFAMQNGIRSPISISVRADAKNPNVNKTYMYQSGLSLPDRENYLRSDSTTLFQQEAFKIHIAKQLTALGWEAELAQKAANNVFEIEKSLANIYMPRKILRNPDSTYNKMPAEDAYRLNERINLKKTFELLGAQIDTIIVGQVNYTRNLTAVMQSYSSEQWSDYFAWQTLSAYIDVLPYHFQKENFAFFQQILLGTQAMKPRWKRVLAKMNGGLSEPLGKLFADTYFSPESKKAVEEMVENVREVYRERIQALDWMSDETKEKALEKLNAFKYKIGYPDQWKNYEGLAISPSNAFQNTQNLRSYALAEMLAKLSKPVDKGEWFMGAHVVNAYYSSSYNEIVFPAGILQPPFFSLQADAAINYGGIGGVIGHEFSHGFDDQGRKYNAFGMLDNWWNLQDSMRFDEKSRMLIEHYEMYEPIPGFAVNGLMTLGENIADLGGLTMAYYAYQKHLQKNPSGTIKDFTPEQRLFLGWAQVWQSSTTEGFLRNQINSDYHSPAMYRVNGPVSQMQEFKEAFRCKEGDPMVKELIKRVRIW